MPLIIDIALEPINLTPPPLSPPQRLPMSGAGLIHCKLNQKNDSFDIQKSQEVNYPSLHSLLEET